MVWNPRWTWVAPAASWAICLLWLGVPALPLLPVLLGLGLFAGVIAAVHHAEVIAAKVGEPFGTLVLALSITTIEVALIVLMMLQGGTQAMALPRDTLFAAVMIIMNGIIGFSLFFGGRRNSVQKFNLEGATEAICTISLIVVLTMVMPKFTSGAGVLSPWQLAFLGLLILVIFVAFTRFQTMLHRDYFLNVVDNPDEPAEVPDRKTALISLGLLIVSLVAVVISAKALSPSLEAVLAALGAPAAVLGILIAFIVLLPEFGASIRAAQADRLQTSLNLALGSAIASIGLTVPIISALAIWMGWPLIWGLDMLSIAFLSLTIFLVALSLRTGMTTRQPGVLHMALFAAYMFFSILP